MNKRLQTLFDLFKHLRSMQEIVEEIETLDYYVHNYDEEVAIDLIDFCVTKYDKYIRRIGSLYQDKVVVDNDPTLYERKDKEEINGDTAFIRDCLIIIGAVQSGIRSSLEEVVKEIKGRK